MGVGVGVSHLFDQRVLAQGKQPMLMLLLISAAYADDNMWRAQVESTLGGVVSVFYILFCMVLLSFKTSMHHIKSNTKTIPPKALST
jgi:hypothetical protein